MLVENRHFKYTPILFKYRKPGSKSSEIALEFQRARIQIIFKEMAENTVNACVSGSVITTAAEKPG